MADQSSKGQNSKVINQIDDDPYFYQEISDKNFENPEHRLSGEKWDHSSDTQTRSNIHISDKISDEKGEKLDLQADYKQKAEHSIDFGSISSTEHSQFQSPGQDSVNIFGFYDSGVHLKDFLFSAGRSSGAIKFERPDDVTVTEEAVTFKDGSGVDSTEDPSSGGGSHVAEMHALLEAEFSDKENSELSSSSSGQNGDVSNNDVSYDQNSLAENNSSENSDGQPTNQNVVGLDFQQDQSGLEDQQAQSENEEEGAEGESQANNGNGNGDQEAPGNSSENNNAENAQEDEQQQAGSEDQQAQDDEEEGTEGGNQANNGNGNGDQESPGNSSENNNAENTQEDEPEQGTSENPVNEQVVSEPEINVIEGNNSNNTLESTQAGEKIFGYGGHDTITGSAGDDVIVGGAGNDTLSGGEGDDTFEIGQGDGYDDFDGGSGSDRIVATDDNVTIGINNHFNPEDSIEEISGDGHSGVSIAGDGSNNNMDFSDTVLTDIEKIDGGSGHDTITGSAGDDVIVGGAGNDTVLLSGNQADYIITENDDGTYTIEDTVGGRNGTDIIDSVETIQFADNSLAVESAAEQSAQAQAAALQEINIDDDDDDHDHHDHHDDEDDEDDDHDHHDDEDEDEDDEDDDHGHGHQSEDHDHGHHDSDDDQEDENEFHDNNGYGNGDQEAPGNSSENNNAENAQGNEQEPSSVELNQSNGVYDISAGGIVTLNVNYVSSDAGYNSSHGFYVADADGNPIGGMIVEDNVKSFSDNMITFDTSDYPGGASVGFFIIPDGNDENSGLSGGETVTFEQINGHWTPMVDGHALSSAENAPAYFSDMALNSDGVNHMIDSSEDGNQNWEDLDDGGDHDYQDVNVDVSVFLEISDPVHGITVQGTVGAENLQGGDGDDTLIYNSDSIWNGNKAHNVETGENAGLAGHNRSSDVFDGGDGHDTIQGSSGDDALFLDDGISSFASGSEARIQNIEEIDMGDGNDIVDMTSSKYTYDQGITVHGGDGDDVIWTSTGNDQIDGGAGNDKLFGGDGDDTLTFLAHQGNDIVDGGSGMAWTDTINLDGFSGEFHEVGWTLTLDNGSSIQSTDDNAGEILLSHDASGTITFDDGGSIDFENIEKIVW